MNVVSWERFQSSDLRVVKRGTSAAFIAAYCLPQPPPTSEMSYAFDLGAELLLFFSSQRSPLESSPRSFNHVSTTFQKVLRACRAWPGESLLSLGAASVSPGTDSVSFALALRPGCSTYRLQAGTCKSARAAQQGNTERSPKLSRAREDAAPEVRGRSRSSAPTRDGGLVRLQ